MNLSINRILLLIVGFIILSFYYWLEGEKINDSLNTIVNNVNQNVIAFFPLEAKVIIWLIIFWVIFKFIKQNFWKPSNLS